MTNRNKVPTEAPAPPTGAKWRHDILLGELVNPTKDNKLFSGMGPVHLTEDDIKSNPALSGLHDGWYDTAQTTRPQYIGKDGTVYMPGLATKGPQQTFKEGDGIGFGAANELGWTKPNAWLLDSREVAFTGHNVFGEPIKNPKYPKPRMTEIDPRLRKATRQDGKGGNTRAGTRAAEGAGDTEGPDVPVKEPVPQTSNPAAEDGPRIVVNPVVFKDKRDALCVAWNEAFRVAMEIMDFSPVAEPTEAQRRFFADTAYKRDEVQLRRTIIARICTFDTSVKYPTDEQLQESVEFLHGVLEAGFPQNQQEQATVQRVIDILSAIPEGPRGELSPIPET